MKSNRLTSPQHAENSVSERGAAEEVPAKRSAASHRLNLDRTTRYQRSFDLAADIARLGDLTREELIQGWIKTYGRPPPKGVSRRLLELSAAYALQAKAFGGLKPHLRKALAAALDPGSGSSRSKTSAPLKPGGQLVRVWNGRTHHVDVVVVYKIDRLTRSLMDFARIVEVFDRHEVSFVSVTQQFNTTTSMGRLTLNVLLSFAQFEREVTSERIRDKIAASKKKGMWMGGPVPMGYRVEQKRLVIEPTEADLVRQLFDLYLEIGSAPRLKERVDELGLITPKRLTRKGQSGGKPFSLGHLYWILSNPLYAGDVHHQGKTWPGQHEPIIARDLWDAVQKKLRDNKIAAKTGTRRKSLLTGLLFDETGDRLSPSHAVRSGRRYRYYVSRRLTQARRKDESGWRLPAEQLEKVVLPFLTDLLSDERRLAKLIGHRDPAVIRRALERAADLVASGIETLAGKRDPVTSILTKIVVAPQALSLVISHVGLCGVLGIPTPETAEPSNTVIELPFTLRRRR